VKNVFITGVAGYFGAKLVRCFESADGIERVVGIDIQPPKVTGKKLLFCRRDIRDPLVGLLKEHRIDTVIHAAWILPPLHDKAHMESVNREGSRNIFKSCAEAGVRHVLHCSSTTAYGFYPDNPPLLTEESPLRGNETFTYSKNKREVERDCEIFRQEHPEIVFTVIRPCFVCGPGFDNPLSHYLQKKIVILPRKTAPFQYLHEDDLMGAIMALLVQEKSGAYNLAADGTITFPEMVTILGNYRLPMPYPLMYVLTAVAWGLRMTWLTEFPAAALDMVRYPWLASSEKLKRETGYRFRYTTREAFEHFARNVGG